MKFAHISDTHIKNLKYHYEYRVIFEQLYEKLREEEVVPDVPVLDPGAVVRIGAVAPGLEQSSNLRDLLDSQRHNRNLRPEPLDVELGPRR